MASSDTLGGPSKRQCRPLEASALARHCSRVFQQHACLGRGAIHGTPSCQLPGIPLKQNVSPRDPQVRHSRQSTAFMQPSTSNRRHKDLHFLAMTSVGRYMVTVNVNFHSMSYRSESQLCTSA
uniref:Uncharacterized protein n=1 Tax=Panagrellus redivivus TaxID=6233 RepID=A0A7E4UNZ8_PANRE